MQSGCITGMHIPHFLILKLFKTMKKKPNPEIFFFLWKRRKILLTMKLLLCFFVFSALNVSGSTMFSQNATFKLAVNGKTVKEVFKDIESQNLTYRELENNLIVITPLFNDNQEVVVSGKVTDSRTGEPMVGVTVSVDATTIGTVTGPDGNYSLRVPDENSILVFSFIGYNTTRIVVAGQREVNISLEEDLIGLEEVIVVGYGTQRRVNVTGSVSTVNFDEEFAGRPLTNASQALGGKVTGLWVSQNSGKPGADAAQLRVRGWGTMGNSNPLIIIDGIEGSLSQLNPNDIENISVLKDAASSAIYGSKAANGVILVTTRQGRYNEKMKISINSYGGVQSLGRRFDMVDNSADLMELMNQAYVNVGSNPRFPDYLISDFRNGTDPFKYPNTNWYDGNLFENAVMHEHNVSVSGGSEQTSAYLSFNYLSQDGIMMRTNTERYGIRANLESNIREWLTVGGRVGYTNQDSEEPYYPTIAYGPLGRVYTILHTSAPFIAPYTRDGRLGGVQAIDRDGVIMYENNNPLIDANNGLTATGQNSYNVNAYANINFTDNLYIRTTIASTGTMTLVDRFNQHVEGYTDTGVARVSRNLNREGIEVIRGYNQRVDNQFYTTLNYDNLFDQKHRIGAIAGMQLEDMSIKTLFARRADPPKEGLTQIDAGTTGIVGEGNLNRLRMFSYFGRVNYAFQDKYLFEANIRADASSRFKEGNRWGIFPGFSAGWRLIEEDFIRNLNIFSDLKIRGSWGKLGNQNIAGYWPYLSIINQTFPLSYNYGGALFPGAAITEMVDENITWETTTSFDFGFEFGFLDNRLMITADYFDKITEDILVRLPIPNIMGGITAPFENIGEMTNKGFELSITYNNGIRDRDRLGYMINANLTNVTNQVTKFRGGDSPDQLFLIREGYSYQTLYGYKEIGIFQSDEEAAAYMHSSGFIPKAGDLKYEDVNGDGRLGFEDKQELGNTIPKFTFGLNPSVRFRGFDLSAVLQGAAGVHVWTANQMTQINGDGATTITSRWRNAWTPENTNTDIPAIKIDYPWMNEQSSFWVQEISFIKLKNLQLGYTLPNAIASRLGMERVYIYANGQNIGSLVTDAYEGYDPERSTTSSGSNIYPAARIISFGVNIEL